MRCYLLLATAAASLSLPALSSASQDGLRQQKDKLVQDGDGEAFSDWAVKTIPKLLSDEECDAIMNFHNVFNREGTDMHEKAVVPVSLEVAQRIQTLAADHGEELTQASALSTFQLLMIHRTTYLHQDEDDAGMVTVMVFLEDNEDAYFWIEELGQKISVEKGKLVAFDARFTHNTVIRGMEKASSVYLLGPTRVYLNAVANMNVQRNLEAVAQNYSAHNYSVTYFGNISNWNVTKPPPNVSFTFEALKSLDYIDSATNRSMAITECPVSCACVPQTNMTGASAACTPAEKSAKSGKLGKGYGK